MMSRDVRLQSKLFCEARPFSLDHEHYSFFDLTMSNQIKEFQERESFLFSFSTPAHPLVARI
jgi:hypothetical protein